MSNDNSCSVTPLSKANSNNYSFCQNEFLKKLNPSILQSFQGLERCNPPVNAYLWPNNDRFSSSIFKTLLFQKSLKVAWSTFSNDFWDNMINMSYFWRSIFAESESNLHIIFRDILTYLNECIFCGKHTMIMMQRKH